MTYNPAEHPYPAHLYGPEGAVRVVWTADEDNAAKAEGWVKHPSLYGKRPMPPPSTPKVGKNNKRSPTLPQETQLEAAFSLAVEAQPDAFDRATAVATLEAAGYEIDKDVTDAELVEALAELAK